MGKGQGYKKGNGPGRARPKSERVMGNGGRPRGKSERALQSLTAGAKSPMGKTRTEKGKGQRRQDEGERGRPTTTHNYKGHGTLAWPRAKARSGVRGKRQGRGKGKGVKGKGQRAKKRLQRANTNGQNG